jgi:molybdopterin-guanine dinucleotide biosynthesis protein A
MSKISDVTGVILAGGKSRRFGTNKAFARFQGVTLLDRVVGIMGSLFNDLFLVTNTPEEYSSLPVLILEDEVPDKGPLGGIVTALKHSPADKVFVVACDMPLLDPQAIRDLIAKGDGFSAVIPVHGGICEYLMALYSRRLLVPMRCCLDQDKLSLEEFCQKPADVVWIPITGSSWFNVNSKKDLEFLEAQHAD